MIIRNILFLLIVIKLFLGCSIGNEKVTEKYLLPNGETLDSDITFRQLNKKMPLEFNPYVGLQHRVCDSIFDFCYPMIYYSDNTSNLSSSSNIYNDDNLKTKGVLDELNNKSISLIAIESSAYKNRSFWDSLLTQSYLRYYDVKLRVEEGQGTENQVVEYFIKEDTGRKQILAKGIFNDPPKITRIEIYPVR